MLEQFGSVMMILKSVSSKVSYAEGKGLLGYFAWHVGVDYNWVLSQLGLYA